MPDLISIIVPLYNSQPYIGPCVDSATGQSYRDIEVILVDDGSTDNSGAVCDEYARQDARVRVFHIPNGGPAAARNFGLQMCRGQWVLFLDADDTLQNDAISLLAEAAETTSADLIIGNFVKVKDGSVQNRNDVTQPCSRILTASDLTEQASLYAQKPNRHLMFAYAWGRLFKTSIIRNHGLEFNSGQWTYEDVAFNFEYLRYVKTGFFLKRPVYRHTVHSHFASATMSMHGGPGKMFGFIPTLDVMADFLRGRIPGRQIEQEIGHTRISLTIIQTVRVCAQWTNGNRQAIKEFLKRLVNDPLVRRDLKHYRPAKGDSKIIPWLIKARLVLPIIWVCRYKAYKRYKK